MVGLVVPGESVLRHCQPEHGRSTGRGGDKLWASDHSELPRRRGCWECEMFYALTMLWRCCYHFTSSLQHKMILKLAHWTTSPRTRALALPLHSVWRWSPLDSDSTLKDGMPFFSCQFQCPVAHNTARSAVDTCTRVLESLYEHLWTVPITASVVDETLKLCKGSFHGMHDRYKKSTTTHEFPRLSLRVQSLNTSVYSTRNRSPRCTL